SVNQISRVTTTLRIKVNTAALESTATQYDQHHFNSFVDVVRELVSVPCVLVIATVSVNAAQHTGVGRHLHFVIHGVVSQGRVIGFDIQFEIFIQTVMTQEADNGFAVEIVLVLGRLHWLGFDQEVAFETISTTVITSHSQEARHMLLLTLDVSVEQAHVTFATAPEHIVFTTECNSRVDSVFQLRTSKGN